MDMGPPAKRQKKVNRKPNPMSDLFKIYQFDHLEFNVGDAKSAYKMFKHGLGMKLVAQSMHETGNHEYVSYILKCRNVKFIFTSPLLSEFKYPESKNPHPNYNPNRLAAFWRAHGNGVIAVGMEVENAKAAWETATKNGAISILPPQELDNGRGGKVVIAEIVLYADGEDAGAKNTDVATALRFMQYTNITDEEKDCVLPGYTPVVDSTPLDYGMLRMDHVVGNVYKMDNAVNNLKKWLGFHTFAAFSKEEISTPWTSLNSHVLANNNLRVLLPINETAPGKKMSQIEEYLKAYNGAGVQHIAIRVENVFDTVRIMRDKSEVGFEFIPTPASYYRQKDIKERMDEHLSPKEQELLKELGILIDEDAEGVLLQIFTKPLFDRPTIFIEIIQRKCGIAKEDVPGCGGFGQGNFKALFESIERMQEARGSLIDEVK